MLLIVFPAEVVGWKISLDLPPCYFLLDHALSGCLVRTGPDPLWDSPGWLRGPADPSTQGSLAIQGSCPYTHHRYRLLKWPERMPCFSTCRWLGILMIPLCDWFLPPIFRGSFLGKGLWYHIPYQGGVLLPIALWCSHVWLLFFLSRRSTSSTLALFFFSSPQNDT